MKILKTEKLHIKKYWFGYRVGWTYQKRGLINLNRSTEII